jgi:hypothetical protein
MDLASQVIVEQLNKLSVCQGKVNGLPRKARYIAN